MKNLTLVLAVLALALAPAVSRSADDAITVEPVFNTIRVGTNSVAYSKPVSVENQRLSGSFGLQFEVSGTTGTVKSLDVQCSNDGSFYVVPAGVYAMATSVTAGTNFYAISVPLAKFIRLRVVTTNDGATIKGLLSYQ